MPTFSVTSQYKESVKGKFHGFDFNASVAHNPAKTGYRNTRVLRMVLKDKGGNVVYHWEQKDLKVKTKKVSVKEINELVRELNAL